MTAPPDTLESEPNGPLKFFSRLLWIWGVALMLTSVYLFDKLSFLSPCSLFFLGLFSLPVFHKTLRRLFVSAWAPRLTTFLSMLVCFLAFIVGLEHSWQAKVDSSTVSYYRNRALDSAALKIVDAHYFISFSVARDWLRIAGDSVWDPQVNYAAFVDRAYEQFKWDSSKIYTDFGRNYATMLKTSRDSIHKHNEEFAEKARQQKIEAENSRKEWLDAHK